MVLDQKSLKPKNRRRGTGQKNYQGGTRNGLNTVGHHGKWGLHTYIQQRTFVFAEILCLENSYDKGVKNSQLRFQNKYA